MGRSITAKAGIDAHLNQSRPDDNLGRKPRLVLDGTGGAVKYGLVFFPIPFSKAGEVTVLDGTLRLRLYSAWTGGPHTITARRVTQKWREGNVTYNTLPTTTASNEATVAVTGGAADDTVELDLTAMLQDVASGGDWFGVRLSINTAGEKKLHSSESPDGSMQPELEMVWTRGAAQPIDLKPAGGRSISKQQPRFQWTFQSASEGEESQAAFQIEIASAATLDGDGTFTDANVVYSSGTIASELNEHDTTGTAFTIADTVVRYWHVRAQDENGQWSPWSDVAQFRRDTQGTLAITNPPAPASNTVEETTPPFTHTLTGRTQEATSYKLLQSDGAGGWVEIWNRRRRATTDLSKTPPNKLITQAAVDYKIQIRTWDTIDREDMKGDRAFLEAERTFTYVRSGTPAAVLTLTATDQGAGVLLEWTRTAQPDYFAIKVDGEIVEDRLASADVLDVAPNYSYVFYGLKPRLEQTIEVEAVVLDGGKYKHSDGNPTVAVTTNPLGIWLVAPEKEIEVFLADRSSPSMEIGESSVSHKALGRRDPVRITDSIRGWEGGVSGKLIDFGGVTALEWHDRLERLKGWAGRVEVRLIMFDFNFPVTLGRVGAPPSSESVYDVDVEFEQVGDFTFVSRV